MILYRYDDCYWADGTQLSLTKYVVVRETKCGYWVRHELDHSEENPELKFVLKGDNGKRLCYTTESEALKGYVMRKKRQVQILSGRLGKARRMLAIAEGMAVAQSTKNASSI